MKKGLLLFFYMLCFAAIPSVMQAQSCDYTLQCYDSFGDGWNGASLSFTVDGVTTSYTVTSGSGATYTISLPAGASVVLGYTTGFYENEVSYLISDSDGIEVFSAGPYPPAGSDIYSFTASCPDCPAVSPSTIGVSAITASSATVSWNSGGNPGTYVVEYGPIGYAPGNGIQVTTAGTSANLTGLNENVEYALYIYRDCGAVEGMSNPAGPITFTTAMSTTPSTCNYTLQLGDVNGWGWGGGFLNVTVGSTTTPYTLNWGTMTFDQTITAFQNYPITLEYVAPNFLDTDNYWTLTYQGDTVAGAGPVPLLDQYPPITVYACPTCQAPGDVWVDPASNFAKMYWAGSPDAGQYEVEYGPVGFTLGTGTVVNTFLSPATLNGLTENTYYNAYITLNCDGGASSYRVGPITFKTAWGIDVGVNAILNPSSECGLSAAEAVSVQLKNFGGAPQSLIPFKYSVNAVEAGIPVPLDGYYTGVLSNDSTTVIDFETTYDFSTPGDYIISAYTELEGDANPDNDATTIKITSIPNITSFPDYATFEDWSNGYYSPEDQAQNLWEYGEPAGIFINDAASGTNVWTTDLDGNYPAGVGASYLYSPCLDFSSVTQVPRVNLSIKYQTQQGYDGFWIEGTKDGGQTWEVVDALAGTINWYNTTSFFTGLPFWSGVSNGWVSAQCPLNGYQGESDCRLRFVFHSETFTFGQNDGAGIDNVLITIPMQKDLAVTAVSRLSTAECGDTEDQLKATITNFGTQAQQGFNVYFNADNGTTYSGLVTQIVAPGTSVDYTFTSGTFNSTGGNHDIQSWVTLAGDNFTANDTLTAVVGSAVPAALPYMEDFEGATLPIGWTTTGWVTNTHNNVSWVLYANIYSFNPSFEATSPYFGPINAGDSLSFDYRLTNYFAGTDPAVLTTDEFDIEVSTDCGVTFNTIYTINESNHIPTAEMTNRKVDLSAFAGQSIKLRFTGTWGNGDYWYDLDNINVIGCPIDLGLESEVTHASSPTATDGSATVTATQGSGPYTYTWSNGQTGETLTDVAPGTYTVTVQDGIDCVDQVEVLVEFVSGIDDLSAISRATLMPNPTTGLTLLDLQMNRSTRLHVQVVDLVGKVVYQTQVDAAGRAQLPLQSDQWPAGIYLVRINADHDVQTLKLVRQ